MSPKIREAIRAVLERLRVVEADARSDDGCSGDGYRLRQRTQQAEAERDTGEEYRGVLYGLELPRKKRRVKREQA